MTERPGPHTASWVAGIAAAAPAWLAMACQPPAPQDERPRSVVLITLDTTRVDHLGSYGSQMELTPHLDLLASEGVVFEENRTQIPITLPSHVSMMTGLRLLEHGVRENGTFFLGEGATTLAELLSDQGYRTGAFLSSFVLDRRFGLSQGFETYDDRMTDGEPTHWQGHAVGRFERTSAFTARAATRWLDSLHPAERFFLWVHFFDPHMPYEPPRRYTALGRSAYAGEIAAMDSQVGALLATARRLAPELVVAVVSDHGESLGEHGIEGHGHDLFEPAVRTVLLLEGSPRLRPGTRISRPSENRDVATTLLRLLDADGELPGRDLLARDDRRSPSGPPAPLYLETLLPALRFGGDEVRGVVAGRWKLLRWSTPRPPGSRRTALFDLEADPEELRDLSGTRTDELEAMSHHLDAALGAVTDAQSQPRDLDEETRRKLEALGYVG